MKQDILTSTAPPYSHRFQDDNLGRWGFGRGRTGQRLSRNLRLGICYSLRWSSRYKRRPIEPLLVRRRSSSTREERAKQEGVGAPSSWSTLQLSEIKLLFLERALSIFVHRNLIPPVSEKKSLSCEWRTHQYYTPPRWWLEEYGNVPARKKNGSSGFPTLPTFHWNLKISKLRPESIAVRRVPNIVHSVSV